MAAIGEVKTFEELDEVMKNKLHNLKICTDIRGGWGKDTRIEINEYSSELKKLSQELLHYRTNLQVYREEFAILKAYITDMESMSRRLVYMRNNLPASMPTKMQVKCVRKEEKGKSSKVSAKENMPPKITKTTQLKSSATIVHKKVKYVTNQEFEGIPKYVRLRLQCAQINTTVDNINEALKGKYTLIKKQRSKMTPIELDQVHTFKEEENNETKGFQFIVDNDLKKFSNVKFTPAVRSVLTILRSLKKLKVIRGPQGLVRYCPL